LAEISFSQMLHICCGVASNFVRGKFEATERDEG
jgi:hypothetical protein